MDSGFRRNDGYSRFYLEWELLRRACFPLVLLGRDWACVGIAARFRPTNRIYARYVVAQLVVVGGFVDLALVLHALPGQVAGLAGAAGLFGGGDCLEVQLACAV